MRLHLVRLYAGIGLALGMFIPVMAQAVCAQKDMKGTWYVYAISANASMAANDTAQCKVKVSAKGKIDGSASSCRFRDSLGRYSIDVPGGSLKVSNSCRVSGSIRLCDTTCTRAIIDHGRLALGKKTFSTVGYAEHDKNIVTFQTGVRK